MRCEEARQFFDAYLDGELSDALATELGAHRLDCADCRRALALMEVTGHIVASDREPVTVDEGFSDRLLACMAPPGTSWTYRFRRSLYLAGPLAAAAVIVLAFAGVFDRGDGEVAGDRVTAEVPVIVEDDTAIEPAETSPDNGSDAAGRALEEWVKQAQRNMATKRESGESLQNALDLTVVQLLDILDEAKDTASGEDHFPGADASGTFPTEQADPVDGDGPDGQ